MSAPAMWKTLCGLAVQLVGSQVVFRKESNILKRLVQRFGPEETERMIQGAMLLHWHSLTSLGSADGLGRRMALAKFWQTQNTKPARQSLESLSAVLKARGF